MLRLFLQRGRIYRSDADQNHNPSYPNTTPCKEERNLVGTGNPAFSGAPAAHDVTSSQPQGDVVEAVGPGNALDGS